MHQVETRKAQLGRQFTFFSVPGLCDTGISLRAGDGLQLACNRPGGHLFTDLAEQSRWQKAVIEATWIVRHGPYVGTGPYKVVDLAYHDPGSGIIKPEAQFGRQRDFHGL